MRAVRESEREGLKEEREESESSLQKYLFLLT